MMAIKKCEIQGPISVSGPGHVDERTSGQVDTLGGISDDNHWNNQIKQSYLDTHALNIIQIILKTLDIPTKAKLVRHPIMLEDGAIRFIVSWITVNVSING